MHRHVVNIIQVHLVGDEPTAPDRELQSKRRRAATDGVGGPRAPLDGGPQIHAKVLADVEVVVSGEEGAVVAVDKHYVELTEVWGGGAPRPDPHPPCTPSGALQNRGWLREASGPCSS